MVLQTPAKIRNLFTSQASKYRKVDTLDSDALRALFELLQTAHQVVVETLVAPVDARLVVSFVGVMVGTVRGKVRRSKTKV